MALNFNIPMPMSGMDSFSRGFALPDNLMRQLLQQKQLAQHGDQFKQQMELRKAQMAHGRLNDDLQRKILQERLTGLQHSNDPMRDINQFIALQNMLTGGRGAPESAQNQPAPSQEMGESMGMFSPEGMQDAQQAPIQAQPQAGQNGGINFEAFRQNPLLRGFFKQKFKIDPLASAAQTPEDKQAAAIDLFKQKEQIKADRKSGDTATNKVLTQNQAALQAIDTVIPMIDEFIDNPDKIYGPLDFDRSKRAAYNAKTGGMIDMLVAAQSLPQVKESVNLVEQQIRRGTGESKEAYKARLEDFKKDLMSRRKKSAQVVGSKKVNFNESAPSTPGGDVVIVIDPDGKRFETTEKNAANLPKGWRRG